MLPVMICVGIVLAILTMIVLDPLGWSWGSREDPAWGRRLGKWWDRHFPPREERERRSRGFDVKRDDEDERKR